MTFVTTAADGNALKNEPATSDRECNCGTWIGHWKTYAKQSTVPTCIVDGCEEVATVGAHVEFTKIADREGLSFIAPMCDAHNKDRSLEFKSKSGYRVARGNQQETCG